MLYPSTHFIKPKPKTRAVTLISTSLDTNAWKQIPFPSPDVIIAQPTGTYGTCAIINIYNDCKHNETIETVRKYLDSNITPIRPTAHDHMIWLGDFNRHHPLWEEERNNHLLTNQHIDHAQPLLELIADHGMIMALPKDSPTLEALATMNWTSPDNLFCTEITAGHLIHCYTDPARRGPRTNHVPTLTTFELQSPHRDARPTRNYNDVDWREFNKACPSHHALLTSPTNAILSAIEKHVPLSRPSPHSKRWWNKRTHGHEKRNG